MSLGQEQEAFAKDFQRLLVEAHRLGYGVRIGECQRTDEQQIYYVMSGKSKTLDSIHKKKCAVDLHFTKDGEIVYPQELGDYWESLDELNEWGGNWTSFVDKPHFQRTV